MEEFILDAFDLTGLTFRTDAGRERVMRALEHARGLYEDMKLHGGSLSRDRLLAILLIGITDDLLRQKEINDENERGLLELVHRIDEMLSVGGIKKP